MQLASLSQGLRIAGWAWIVALPITAALGWPIFEQLGLSIWPLQIFTIIGLSVGVTLLSVKGFVPDTKRVLMRAMGGGLAFVPLLIPFMFLGTAFFFLSPMDSLARVIAQSLLWCSIILWCALQLRSYNQRIIDRRFIEREFSVKNDCIVLRAPQKTDLDPSPISDKTFFGKIYYRFGPILIMLVPLAYPLQRLFSDAGGVSAVLLLLAILGTPLTFYILGRLTCGAYLYIYKVWQLERQHGKPVVFDG